MSFSKKQFLIEVMKVEDGDVLFVHVDIGQMPKSRAEQYIVKLRDSMRKWLNEANKKVELILAPMTSEKKKIQIEKLDLGKLNIIRDDTTGMNPTQIHNYMIGVYRFLSNNEIMKKTPILVLPSSGFETPVKMDTLEQDLTAFIDSLCSRLKEQDAETKVSIDNFMQSKKEEIDELTAKVAALRKEYLSEFDRLTKLQSQGLPKEDTLQKVCTEETVEELSKQHETNSEEIMHDVAITETFQKNNNE